jgi:PAS domain S-box-containing protein
LKEPENKPLEPSSGSSKAADFLSGLRGTLVKNAGGSAEADVITQKITDALLFLTQRNFAAKGEDFFASLATYLAQSCEMAFAFIGKLETGGQSVRTLALYGNGRIQPNIEYRLPNSPCQNVVGQKLRCYLSDVQRLFPRDELLAELNVQSYIGMPLWDSGEKPIGLIVVMDIKAIENPQPAQSLLQLVAIRAAAEMEKKAYEEKIEQSRISAERRAAELDAMFETLAEPAILYDASGKVTKANAAALEAFGFDASSLSAAEYAKLPEKLSLRRPDGKRMSADELPSRRALRGESVHNAEIAFTNAKGIEFVVENSSMPLVSEGKIVGAVATWHDITDRKKTEDALRQSELRFRSLVETTSDWVWATDADAVYTYSSPKVKEVLGYEPQEIIGKKPFEFMEPQEAARVARVFAETTAARKPLATIENVNLRKDGRKIVLETSGVPIFDTAGTLIGYQGMDRDITARKQVEDNLRQSEERFRTLAEAIPAIVWTAGPDGTVDYYNSRWYEYSGLPQNAPEADWHEVFHPDDLSATVEVWTTAVRDEKPYYIEHRLRRNDGLYRWHLSRGLPLRDKDGRVVKWFGMAMDIDDQKSTLEELERLKDELQDKNEELASIIGIASHDLRSPLVNIKGFSGEISKDIGSVQEILAEVGLPEEVRKKLEIIIAKHLPEAVSFIQNSASAMNQMLKGLMQVAKAGITPIQLQDLEMNAILARIVANFQFNLKETGIKLEIAPLPACRGDLDLVTQVFSNLIDNAIKFREPARDSLIQVYGSAETNRVTYCVEDNGQGIAEENQSKIFEVFHRLSPDATKGEGLGLTIAKRMIERLGGRIWLDSEKGKGSKFYVCLPAIIR